GPALPDQPHGLELPPERARAGIERPHVCPVGVPLHGVLGASLGAARVTLVRDAAAPVLHAVHAARHHLDEIQIPPTVKAEHRVGEPLCHVIHVGNVTPERDRRPVDRAALDRRKHPLALRHGRSRYHRRVARAVGLPRARASCEDLAFTRRNVMPELSRRAVLAGSVAAAITARAPFVPAQKRTGTLRFGPHADLKILDPIWTTAYITRNHGYMIFDALFALDADLKIRPQMVEKHTSSMASMKWSFTLRDGLKFHDGQPVTAEDCVASIKRWGGKDAVGRLMMAAIGKMAPVDKKTFTIDLETPFGLVLDGLGKPSASPCFIMPARLAATDPNEQVKDVIGSGPFKFSKD